MTELTVEQVFFVPINKPMLAYTIEDTTKLRYPVWCTVKIDGYRALKVSGKAISRSFKPIPNTYTRNWLESNIPDNFDGELITTGTFQDVMSAFTSHAGKPNFTYCVFDLAIRGVSYLERMARLKEIVNELPVEVQDKIVILEPVKVENQEELLKFEQLCLDRGQEGIMVRSGDGLYKCGRSTNREAALGKLKRFTDSEAVVIGFEEMNINQNTQTRNALGHAERSTAKAGMVAAGTLGNLLVRDVKTGLEFSVGSGLNDALREEIWTNQDKYVGKIITYKHFEIGSKDKPRFPIFKSFRDATDMGE